MPTTARKAKPAKRAKQPKRDHEGSLERIYTRVKPETKRALDQLAAADERSTMQYLRLLIEREVAKRTKQQKGK